MAQSGYGKVVIFEDFLAGEDIVAATAATRAFGDSGLRVIGQGIGRQTPVSLLVSLTDLTESAF